MRVLPLRKGDERKTEYSYFLGQAGTSLSSCCWLFSAESYSSLGTSSPTGCLPQTNFPCQVGKAAQTFCPYRFLPVVCCLPIKAFGSCPGCFVCLGSGLSVQVSPLDPPLSRLKAGFSLKKRDYLPFQGLSSS